MCVVAGGEADDADMFSRLQWESSQTGECVAMGFASRDSGVVVQGHNSKVFVAAAAIDETGAQSAHNSEVLRCKGMVCVCVVKNAWPDT